MNPKLEWTDREVEVAELIEEFVSDELDGHRFYLENGMVAKVRNVRVLVEDYDAEWWIE